MPRAAIDPGQRARDRLQRTLRSRDRLKDRITNDVRGMVLKTSLFRANPELGDPDVYTFVYAQFVDVITSLNGGQLHILPQFGRTNHLEQFGSELGAGFERIGSKYRLEVVRDPGSPFGHSQPVLIGTVPSGYHAVFSRKYPER